jgi:DNA (cytosine-5)-methyltransferase 1
MTNKHFEQIDVLDLFCGCGGASSGFQQVRLPRVRYRAIGGVDIDEHALRTYERNIGAPGINMDVARISTSEALLHRMLDQTTRNPKNPLILIGCAPCQGFSSHTKMRSSADPRKNLLPHFARLATQLNPEAIFIENVPEMLAKRNWRHFRIAKSTLEEHGYVVRARIYNFAEFGLPQERFRAVVLAFKRPFQMPEPFVKSGAFRTVRDVIGHLPILHPGEQVSDDPMHITSSHRKTTIAILRAIPKDGGNRPVGVGPKCLDKARERYGGYTDVYGRLWWDRPALTVTARCRTPSCGRFVHPEQDRGLSVREAALLQGFPASYFFDGPFDDKFKQIGNAVPPIVAKFIGEHMLGQLSNTKKSQPWVVDSTADVADPIGPGFSILINGIKRRRDKCDGAFADCN